MSIKGAGERIAPDAKGYFWSRELGIGFVWESRAGGAPVGGPGPGEGRGEARLWPSE